MAMLIEVNAQDENCFRVPQSPCVALTVQAGCNDKKASNISGGNQRR
jgi:hypothetical protein